ncbi:hypothetical protein MPSI1_003632 [Malassezia psittaci]|uniref:ML-like domain-containing protein n=1 Tax=Malassezia psittaci TaxID=1821823 RepID=A0AAF0FCQ5_9BASI|nr:hypothetical protein MPSI1_003632 [Malassezia psittaci]
MEIQFFRQNHSLEFQLTAAALPSDLNMSAELNLFAYGRDFVSLDIDLCEIGSGSLCPIPQYNFSGGGTYVVPEKYSNKIPKIVYSVPDIEVLGVLRLTQHGTNTTVGCMQVTLANGLTARSKGVLWGTVGLALLVVASMALTLLWRDSLSALQWRIVDVVGTFQTVVMTSMLTLIQPLVFHEYSLSFAWSYGLVYEGPMQRSIYRTRINHGSNDDDIPYAALMQAQYARLANLYPAQLLNPSKPAIYTGSSGTFSGLFKLTQHITKRMLYAPNTGAGGEMAPASESNPVVWAAQNYGFSQTGLLYYVESLKISPNSAFLTVLVNWLLVACMISVLFAIASALNMLTHKLQHRFLSAHRTSAVSSSTATNSPTQDDKASLTPTSTQREFPSLTSEAQFRSKRAYILAYIFRLGSQWLHPIFVRMTEIATTPLLVMIFFQWAHATGWPSHVAAAFCFLALIVAWSVMLAPMFLHVAHSRDVHSIYFAESRSPYDSASPAARFGSLAHPYRPKYYWFTLVHLLCAFLRACFVAFPQRNNLALRQAVGLLVIDLLLWLVLVILRPGRDKFENFVQILLTTFRIIGWSLCVALTTQANIWGIPRAVLGFVLLAVTAIAIVCIFVLFLAECLIALVSRNQRWSRRFGEFVAPQSYNLHESPPASQAHNDESAMEIGQSTSNGSQDVQEVPSNSNSESNPPTRASSVYHDVSEVSHTAERNPF